MKDEAATVSRTLSVSCIHGVHLRVAAQIVSLAREFQSAVSLSFGSTSADAKSILGLLRLGATQGSLLTMTARGPDAQQAADAIERLFGTTRTLCGSGAVALAADGDLPSK